MAIDRRRLLKRVAGATLAAQAAGVPTNGAAAQRDRAVVIVRTEDGYVAIDSGTGDIQPWEDPVPATPGAGDATSTPAPVPGQLVTALGRAPVTWWMASANYSAYICRVGGGDGATWWWVGGDLTRVKLDLPPDLELAYPAGLARQWFHGGSIEPAHLGSGTLRLVAVETATGEIVLDQELDRRLELAATTVSAGSEIVAHLQAGNAGVELWAMDLRRGGPPLETGQRWDPAPVAASAIDLRVAADGDWMVIAAGIAWDWPGHPEPMVLVQVSRDPDTVFGVETQGELVAIVPADT